LRFVIVHLSVLLFNAVLLGRDHLFQNILLQVYRSEYPLSSTGAANFVSKLTLLDWELNLCYELRFIATGLVFKVELAIGATDFVRKPSVWNNCTLSPYGRAKK